MNGVFHPNRPKSVGTLQRQREVVKTLAVGQSCGDNGDGYNLRTLALENPPNLTFLGSAEDEFDK